MSVVHRRWLVGMSMGVVAAGAGLGTTPSIAEPVALSTTAVGATITGVATDAAAGDPSGPARLRSVSP